MLLGYAVLSLAHAHAEYTANPYVLGPDDQISVQVLHAPEITDKNIRIDSSGYITLPLAGRIKAAGLTVDELQRAIASRLDEIVREPQVSVSVTEYHSQPVSVVGAVNSPGVYQLQGNKRLLDVMSMAGGPKTEAADTLRITRKAACGAGTLPNMHVDPKDGSIIGEVSVSKLLEGRDPAGNIALCPNDVVTLPRAPIVYVLGEVRKPGGFPLRDKETASVLEAVAMSEGLSKTAAANRAKILRVSGNGNRQEIQVDIKGIVEGRAEDLALRSDDILFVPNSAGKAAWARSTEAIVQMATGVVVWGRF